ncbi:MAG: TolC family protein, partial [Planctomycetota bacterium]
LQVQQLAPAIAGTFEKVERARFDPVLFASGAVARERTQEVSRATGTAFETEGQEGEMAVGVAKEFPTGTRVEGGVEYDRSYSDRTPDQHDVRGFVSLTQALLRGRGTAVNLARVDQAHLEELVSQEELRGFVLALVAETERAAWDLAQATRQIEIFEGSLQLADRQLAEGEARVQVGAVAETELVAMKAEVAVRKQALIGARARHDRLRMDLLRLLNPGGAWGREVTVSDDPRIAPVPLEPVADHAALAVKSRPEVAEARLRLEQGRLEVVRTKNGLLPRLDFFVAYGKTGFADSFSGSVESLNEPTYDLSFGLSFERPFGNRERKALHDRATFSTEQERLSIENLVEVVEWDVQKAYVEVRRAEQQIEASAATVELQEEVVRVEEEKFRVGKSTGLLVAQAQRDLLVSQIANVDAIVDYRKALIELYRMDGSLLERRGVLLPTG